MKLFEASTLAAENDIVSLYESDTFDLESCFLETIDYLIEAAREEGIAKKEMYMGIYEAHGNSDVIHESVDAAIETFKAWIQKAIEYIKKQAKKFFDKLVTWIGDNTYIARNVDMIDNISDFEVKNAYKYSIPKEFPTNPLSKVYEKVNSIATNITVDAAGTKDMIKEFKSGVDLLSITDTSLDKVRGELLGKSHSISKETFDSSVRVYFRCGAKEPSTIKASKEYMQDIKKVYQKNGGYESTIKSVYAQIKSVEDCYNKIVASLSRLQDKVEKIVGDSDEPEKENLYIVAMAYINKMINYTNHVNSDVMIFFSSELDAIREMAVMNNNIAAKVIAAQKKEVVA